MPYIPEKRKNEIYIGGDTPKNAGELNFQLTQYILEYLEEKGESYQTYNDILGVLTAIPQEFYRRKIAPYEDKKIDENGDVF